MNSELYKQMTAVEMSSPLAYRMVQTFVNVLLSDSSRPMQIANKTKEQHQLS